MSFYIDYILNGNLYDVMNYLNEEPIIENFMIGGMDAGNKNTTLNETQVKNLADTTRDVNQAMMVTNSAKLLKSVINNVVNKNQSTLLQALAASNNISIAGGNISGNLNLTNIKQQNQIDLSGNISVAQTVQNNITTQITDEVTKTFKKAALDSATTGTSTDIGATLGKALDTVSSLGTSFIDNTGKVIDGSLSMTAGSKTKTETITNTENVLKDTFKLNSTFTVSTNDDFNNAISNQLSTENLSKCAQEANANNNLDLSKINVSGNVNIDSIDQVNFVNSALTCAFNQNIVNNLATIFVTNYSNLIDNMTNNTTINNSGDILAAGTAGAVLVSAAGAAVSDASQGLGSGLSTGAQGLGSGVSNTIDSLGDFFAKNYILIIAVCIVLIIAIGAGLYFMLNQGGSTSLSDTANTMSNNDT